MVPHYRDHDFVRQVQERGVELALDDARKLVEVHDEVQEIRVTVQPEPSRFRLRRQILLNLGAPLRRTDYDAIGGQLFFVLRESTHADSWRAQEAVASRCVPGRDPRTRQP